ncbi:DUF2807 domain-containing protein [Sphingomonas sp. BGYR3]|uniref:head GIN domain-containing protein n=1 Tax=Sphingomonas sp. BGYR3 TaxID=2975483 RepID=UPI0021A64B71|nr:head GIN domain-containing protein [Sphingomonas sp. BGYR3]MDG5487997.1 DUF2807 domain-containing protein [Sphingomonas sp. BGYR3]
MLRSATLTALALAAIACTPATGTPPPDDADGTRSFSVAGFDRIALKGSDTVDVRHGDAFSVTARGQQKVLDSLELVNRDGTLVIARKKDAGWNWGSDDKARLTIVLPRITGASLAGSGHMTIDRADTGFAGDLAGSGNLTVGRLAGDRATLAVAGSGTLSVAGEVGSVEASIAGSGDIRAEQLRAASASVSIAGSGDVRIDVNGTATVSVLGSGNADLGDDARCTINKRGSGTVRCGR